MRTAGKKGGGTAGRRKVRRKAPSRDLFRDVAEAAPLMVWMSDSRGRVVYVNRPWEEFTGRTPVGAIGNGWTANVHDEDRRTFLETYRSALAARQPFKTELRLRRSDGEYRWIMLSGVPRWSHHRFAGYVGSAVDSTVRRHGEKALRESEARYQRLTQSIGDIFFALDADLRCTYWNRAAEFVTGMPATDALGRPLAELLPAGVGTLDTFVRGVVVSATAGGTTCDIVREGQRRTFEVLAYPWNEGVSVLMKDVTPRLVAEAELRSSERKYRTVFESANDAILILDPETEVILEANPRACEVYGFTPEELIGRSLKSLRRDGGRGEVRRALETGACNNYETVHLRRDGTPLYLVVNSSTIEYQGRTALLSINHDVSHAQVAKEHLTLALALQESILEGARDAVFVTDRDGNILIANAAAQRITGRTRQELATLRIDRLFDDHHHAGAEKAFASARDGAELLWEGCFTMADGSRLPLEVTFRGVDIAEQRYVQITLRDITKRKRAEEALRAGEERYRQFLDQTSDGMWRVEFATGIQTRLSENEQIEWMYRDGVVAESNAAMARMVDVETPSMLNGSALGEVVLRRSPHTLKILHSFIREQYRICDVEARAIDAQGDVRHFLLTLVGTVDNGCLVRIWGNQRDVTARMQSERELRLLAQTVTSAQDNVFITDLNEVILYVNEAVLRTYGYSEEELVGSPVAMLRVSDVSADDIAAVKPATLDGGWNGEILNRKKDGTTFPIELWTSVVRNDEGDPVAMVGVARDITERKRAEEQIRASLREKDVLLKEVHHRVKNNLQIISSLLNLQSEYIHDPEMLKVFNESQHRVKSMALVHEKLYRSSNLAEIDFGEYVRELSAQLIRSYGMELKGVELRVHAEQIALGIDRAIPCGIILNELVSNSLKHGFPNSHRGTVYIDVRAVPEHTMRLIVGDTGVGLPADFDMEAAESLGLKLVRMLAYQLQGELRLERSAALLGGVTGTEYTIIL
jgi:PAS domain S-box-containing protein